MKTKLLASLLLALSASLRAAPPAVPSIPAGIYGVVTAASALPTTPMLPPVGPKIIRPAPIPQPVIPAAPSAAVARPLNGEPLAPTATATVRKLDTSDVGRAVARPLN